MSPIELAGDHLRRARRLVVQRAADPETTYHVRAANALFSHVLRQEPSEWR